MISYSFSFSNLNRQFFFTARSKKYAMTCLFHMRLDFCRGKRTNFAWVVVWVKSWMKRIVTLYN